MAIRTAFFDGSVITGADLAATFASCLADGFMNSVTLTVSNNALTIPASYLVGCGRVFQLQSAETVSLSPGASATGYQRVYCQISVASPSNPSITFVAQSLVSDVASFTALTQNDINDNGTIYQFEICVIYWSSSTATIYRQIGKARPKVELISLTVAADQWDSDDYTIPTATVSCSYVHENNKPIVSYSSDSFTYWREYGIFCTGYGEGYITLAALYKPEPTIGVEIRL